LSTLTDEIHYNRALCIEYLFNPYAMQVAEETNVDIHIIYQE